jgi:hypothetical protein
MDFSKPGEGSIHAATAGLSKNPDDRIEISRK